MTIDREKLYDIIHKECAKIYPVLISNINNRLVEAFGNSIEFHAGKRAQVIPLESGPVIKNFKVVANIFHRFYGMQIGDFVWEEKD